MYKKKTIQEMLAHNLNYHIPKKYPKVNANKIV